MPLRRSPQVFAADEFAAGAAVMADASSSFTAESIFVPVSKSTLIINNDLLLYISFARNAFAADEFAAGAALEEK